MTSIPMLTIRVETTRDHDGVFYRAGFNDREMGPWMRTPESAVRKMFETVDPRSLMNAIGVSPVLTEEVAGLCSRCGVPLVYGEKPCCSLTCESI